MARKTIQCRDMRIRSKAVLTDAKDKPVINLKTKAPKVGFADWPPKHIAARDICNREITQTGEHVFLQAPARLPCAFRFSLFAFRESFASCLKNAPDLGA